MTVCITTFIHRYEKYFKPLLTQIKNISSDIEIIILINGEHKEKFNDEYRKNMLLFLADFKNVYPIFFPEFRGLSKLWNTGIIHSTSDNILLLNDDVTINNPHFFKEVFQLYQANNNKPFKINGSWSHVMLNKADIVYNGLWFDERLLGIGEEDGYFEWMYEGLFGKQFPSFNINGVINHVDMSHSPSNIIGNNSKYSKFNSEIILYKGKDSHKDSIFILDNDNGFQRGMFPYKVNLAVSNINKAYYSEYFYRENKDKL